MLVDCDRLRADRLLADLDERQRAAVTTPSTLVAVIAAAGSGKTRVLTRRIAHRIVTGSADAQHTLALTFTREAAGELRRRLRRSGMREPVEAGTFHAVALGLLRQRWRDTDRQPPAIINDPERLLAEAAADVAGGPPLDVLAAEQSWLAARALDPLSYAGAARSTGRRPGRPLERIEAALTAYAQLKRRRGVIDLDDLLTVLGNELAGDADFAGAVRWRFRHVLVDEAQDLNPAQYRVLRAILGERRDLFLVGDPAQAIYGFNGSDPALLADVDRHLPGIEVIRLPANHRCTPQIVAAGMSALRASGQPADAVSARDDGVPVELLAAADEDAEAETVTRLLQRCPPAELRRGAVAVLARTHHQLTRLRRPIERAGVPVRHDALATGTPLAAALRRATVQPSASRLRAWAHDVIDLPPAGDGQARPAEALAEHRVARVVLDYLREAPLGDGAGFRAWVLAARPFVEPGDADGIELLTFHAAKGREWHTVIVTGVETGLVPHRSAATVEAKAEEARLLHVALTRASDRLVVTRAQRRRGYQRKLSPLLEGFDPGAGVVPEARAVPEAIATLVDELDVDVRHLRLESLRAWRDGAARAGSLLPTQVCSDADLAAIAAAPPTTAEALAELTGFGPLTAARHFGGIRDALGLVG